PEPPSATSEAARIGGNAGDEQGSYGGRCDDEAPHDLVSCFDWSTHTGIRIAVAACPSFTARAIYALEEPEA
ncbi:hypothetical protein, partial [Methylobacterium variabile]|uniref:hypothetical protein n=1 Tax=Methylobacterium variabile TaxID=298794 RepID=UPI001AE05E8F